MSKGPVAKRPTSKDLTEKHKVKGYPTGVLFDADGKEIARYVGYQSVKDTTEFFKKLKK